MGNIARWSWGQTLHLAVDWSMTGMTASRRPAPPDAEDDEPPGGEEGHSGGATGEEELAPVAPGGGEDVAGQPWQRQRAQCQIVLERA